MSEILSKPSHPKANLYFQREIFSSISKFAELEHRIARLPTKQERGDAFEVFAEAYLSTQPLYQTKTVWPISRLPLTIKERFALGLSDVGVDGIFETHLGEFHAYQAKFRTGRPALTWEELSTFMGLTDRITERLVFTNCNELSEVVTDRRGFYAIRGTDLDRLQAEDFEAIHLWLRGARVERACKNPLPRQQEALEAILNTFVDKDRATIIMPCGTGKTLVALWTVEQLKSRNVLVLVPSLALVSQTLRTWLRETRWTNASFLCVCSDPTVTSGADSLVVHQADVDFPVTTDIGAVQAFLERATDGVKIVFSTYQSARVVAAGMGEAGRFDVGIFDEAHKTAGREGALFSFALSDANLPISKRLFMTATPRHYKLRQGKGGGEAELVYSMDAPEIYGPVTYRLSFAQAVKENMICDYKVLVSVITTEMVNEEMLRIGKVMVEGGAIKARQVANQLAVKDAFEKYKIEKVITFHRSVAAAASFTTIGPEGIEAHVPELTAFHVNGGMSASKREPILRSFADGNRTLISNARCLTEGVDVPAVDMVAFLSPKRSRIDIVQATGRAMRKNDATHKTHGYVLLPLFLEERTGESLEAAVARADFDEIWAVLQALQEHDEVLAETIAQIREARDLAGGFDDQAFREKVEIIAPEISLDTLRQSITTKLLDALISVRGTWDSMFQALLRFKNQHGHCNVQWRHDVDLAFWVLTQREAKQRGTLSLDKVRRLKAIEFEWEPSDVEWEKMFEALVRYKLRHGHTTVLRTGAKDRQLAIWCEQQRQRRRRLSVDQVQRLEQLGFSWNRMARPSVRPVSKWEAMFELLVQYKQQHGHCSVSRQGARDLELAIWCEQQRGHRLSMDQVQRLEMIGFEWEPHDAQWEASFEALSRFRQQYGHCNVTRNWPADTRLGRWSENQRRSKRSGKLSRYRLRRLEELGFEWDSWEAMFASLLEFKQQHGHCNVSFGSSTLLMLGAWVNKQRHDRRRGCLNEERIRRLDEIGFIWDMLRSRHSDSSSNKPRSPHSDSSRGVNKVQLVLGWDAMFDALICFKQKHGHCNVPPKFLENPELAKWAERQRLVHELGGLTEGREKRLEELGFEWSRNAAKKKQDRKPSA